jgi:hypothetical protein
MKLVTVFESTDRLSAEMAEGLLKDSQILTLLQCDDGAGLFPGIESYFGCRILVREEDETKARQVLGTSTKVEQPTP